MVEAFNFTKEDEYFMSLALDEARKAFEEDEVPVGAVLVSREGELLAKDHNRIISLCDPTAHAEILVLREGAKRLGNYRLLGCKLYVTLEPCAMCAYAMVLARIAELIFSTLDPKTGACVSLYQIPNDPRLNHRVKVRYGLFKKEAELLLKEFFKAKR
jgi:tRNA(adenine34) deaminase